MLLRRLLESGTCMLKSTPSMITFKYLRRDGDAPMTLSECFGREVRECRSEVVDSLRVHPNLRGVKLAAWVLAYHAGMTVHPMVSRRRASVGLMVEGRYVEVHFRRNQSDIYILRENFIERIYLCQDLPLGNVSTIVDLGANIGLSALYFQTQFPHARIVCVEPVSDNVEMLRINASANGLAWEIEQAAACGVPGTVTLHPNEWWSSSTVVEHVAEAREGNPGRMEKVLALPSEEVPGYTVDQILDRHQMPTVDLLKMDIEGAEAGIFAEDTAWLGRVKVLIIEIHDKYVTRSEIEAKLAEHGFEKQVGRPGPTDAFVNTRFTEAGRD